MWSGAISFGRPSAQITDLTKALEESIAGARGRKQPAKKRTSSRARAKKSA